jgi:hypothetical protein
MSTPYLVNNSNPVNKAIKRNKQIKARYENNLSLNIFCSIKNINKNNIGANNKYMVEKARCKPL